MLENNFQKIVIANWKMELGVEESRKLALKMVKKFKDFSSKEVVICPDFLSLYQCSDILKDSNLKLGSQDSAWEDKGAYTGEVSPRGLKEVNCEYVILGHSERRQYLGEDYNLINLKLKKVLEKKELTPIVCLGETKEDRNKKRVKKILEKQVSHLLEKVSLKTGQKIIFAYEPIWAIGTGEVIRNQDLEEVYKIIAQLIKKIKGEKFWDKCLFVYGGSVNGKNIQEISRLKGINGCLIGGAGLKTAEFYKIARIILDS